MLLFVLANLELLKARARSDLAQCSVSGLRRGDADERLSEDLLAEDNAPRVVKRYRPEHFPPMEPDMTRMQPPLALITISPPDQNIVRRHVGMVHEFYELSSLSWW